MSNRACKQVVTISQSSVKWMEHNQREGLRNSPVTGRALSTKWVSASIMNDNTSLEPPGFLYANQNGKERNQNTAEVESFHGQSYPFKQYSCLSVLVKIAKATTLWSIQSFQIHTTSCWCSFLGSLFFPFSFIELVRGNNQERPQQNHITVPVNTRQREATSKSTRTLRDFRTAACRCGSAGRR